MRAKKGSVLMVMAALFLGLALHTGVANSELRVKFGALSHRDPLFGNHGVVVSGDYLLYFKDRPFGIAGGLEGTYSVINTYYPHRNWGDVAATLSFLYFPTPAREVYLGMGLEHHWVTEGAIGLLNWSQSRRVLGDSGLGLHIVVGFNLGEHIFLEGKICTVAIGYKNLGGISLQIGAKF